MNRAAIWRSGLLIILLLVIASLTLRFYNVEDSLNTEAMLGASVSIKAITHVRIDNFGDSVWNSQSGSGFLVSQNKCEIWTNNHVIADAAMVYVYPRGWQADSGIPATVVNSSPRMDIAVLRMQNCQKISAAVLGNSKNLQPGDEIYAVGNPLGDNPDSISRGIISHTERIVGNTVPLLQTDATINKGSSGGALFNKKGEVIGMNAALAVGQSGQNAGISYAIPIDMVAKTVTKLYKGPPSWGSAGIKSIISDLSPEAAKLFGLSTLKGAVIVTKTPQKGPCKDKLFARDTIYAVAGLPVTDVTSTIRTISGITPGDTIDFNLKRNGKDKTVSITLGNGWNPEPPPNADYYNGYLGLSLENWENEEGDKGKFKTPVITKVKSLGPAHRSQISSNQHYTTRTGPFVSTYLLDVKTITGVVLNGKYQAVKSIDEIDAFSKHAYFSGSPILLEIENWSRVNPYTSKQPLLHHSTSFYKITPMPASKPNTAIQKASAAAEHSKLQNSTRIHKTANEQERGV